MLDVGFSYFFFSFFCRFWFPSELCTFCFLLHTNYKLWPTIWICEWCRCRFSCFSLFKLFLFLIYKVLSLTFCICINTIFRIEASYVVHTDDSTTTTEYEETKQKEKKHLWMNKYVCVLTVAGRMKTLLFRRIQSNLIYR